MPDARPMMTSHVVPIARTVLRCWQDAFAPYCSAVRSRHSARNIAMAGKNRSRRGETPTANSESQSLAVLLDDAAGDAAPGLAGRIGLVVVGCRVNDDGRAVRLQNRIRLILVQCDGGTDHFEL